jgi:hypothetical protein
MPTEKTTPNSERKRRRKPKIETLQEAEEGESTAPLTFEMCTVYILMALSCSSVEDVLRTYLAWLSNK